MWKCSICNTEAAGIACRTCGTLRWEDPFALRSLSSLGPGDIRALRDRKGAWEQEARHRQAQRQEEVKALVEQLLEARLAPLQKRLEALEAAGPRQAAPAPQPFQKAPAPTARAEQFWQRAQSVIRAEGLSPEAIRQLCGATEQGHVQAMYTLGKCHESGTGVGRPDNGQAVRWFRKAAESGYAEAQLALGEHYEQGLGVEQSLRDAVHWYEMAALQGLAAAQYRLGRCYKTGIGTTKSLLDAAKWLKAAGEQDHQLARAEYQSLFSLANSSLLRQNGYHRF